MNVWDFLHLPSNHRPDDKIVQYVRHHEDLPSHKINYPREAQIKKDGVYGLIVIRGDKCGIFGRTGQQLKNVAHLQPDTRNARQREVVLITEICCDCCSLETLSGIVNPNRVNGLDDEQQKCVDKMYLYVHDLLWLSEFIDGESHRGYQRRESTLAAYLRDIDYIGYQADSTWVHDEEETVHYAEHAIHHGQEGAVFKEPDAGWKAGRQNEVATKIVRGVDFDLLIVGVEEGLGKHSGMVGNVLIRWRKYGKKDGEEVTLPVDGRFEQTQRKEWFVHPELIVGKIAHVHALQLGSKGALRLPKVRVIRFDKTTPDL